MKQFLRRYALILSVFTAVSLSLWLYWPTLSYPLIYDTLLHIRITGTLDFSNVWLPTEAFGFYRPLTFFPMLVVQRLFGYYPGWLMHGLNVGQHALNVGLLVWLSWRLWQNGRLAFLTGLLFALFPFSYQAIAVYGHNVHPTTAGLILFGCHTYLTAWRQKRPFWWSITLICFILSLLSHESAVLFGGFVALVQWNEDQKWPAFSLKTVSPRQSPWLIFLLLGAAYLIGYQFLPLTRPPDSGAFDLENLWIRAMYLLQAIIYPLAWLGNRLPIENAAPIIVGGTAVLLAWIGWLGRRVQNRLPLLLGFGWTGAAYMLIAIPLSTDYLLHGPRLLYLGSVGVALLWGVLLDRLFEMASFRWLGVGVGTAVTAFILISSTLFIQERLNAYAQLTSPVEVVENVMKTRSSEAGVVLVNLPEWLDPGENRYPVGVEFVSMLGHYLFVDELMVNNLNDSYPVAAVSIPEKLAETPYHYSVHAQTALDAVDFSTIEQHLFVTSYGDTGLETVHTGWVGGETAVSTPLAFFAPYQLLQADAIACGATTNISLTWQPTSEVVSPTTSVFVQVLDQNGQLIAQSDGPPLGVRPDMIVGEGRRPLTDLRTLDTANQTVTAVLVGVYDYVNGERFLAKDAQNNPLPDNAVQLWIENCTETE
ncbi:MAG: hypothetical protein GY943_07585 [Chloroflexi bacterium]|nr:hypothetical protein [Chloroflexota bacterium]